MQLILILTAWNGADHTNQYADRQCAGNRTVNIFLDGGWIDLCRQIHIYQFVRRICCSTVIGRRVEKSDIVQVTNK